MGADTCERCDQMTLGHYDYRDVSLSISGSVWRTRVTLCPSCIVAICSELGIDPPDNLDLDD